MDLLIAPFRRILFFAALVLLPAFCTGCNLFDPLYGEGSEVSVDDLLADARVALTNGENDTAIAYLERALALEPQNGEVRIELSSAVLKSLNLSVNSVREIATFVSLPRVDSLFGKQPPAMVCNFGENQIGLTQLQLLDNPTFVRFDNNLQDLRRVENYLDIPLVENDPPLGINLLGKGWLLRAFSRFSISIVELNLQATADETEFFRLAGGNIGYCNMEPTNLTATLEFVKCNKLPEIDEALVDLSRRQTLFGTSTGSASDEIIQAIQDVSNAISSSIDYACN